MRVRITDEVNNSIKPTIGEFDEVWATLGHAIKEQLRTFDPDRTWLNLYMSHDGKPSFVRTIAVTEQDGPVEGYKDW
jgi:hypothetical protein